MHECVLLELLVHFSLHIATMYTRAGREKVGDWGERERKLGKERTLAKSSAFCPPLQASF
jgi:hypothetical protein